MFGPDYVSQFRLEERTLGSDSYDAQRWLNAAFLSTEVNPTDSLRLIAGVRLEAVSGAAEQPEPLFGHPETSWT